MLCGLLTKSSSVHPTVSGSNSDLSAACTVGNKAVNRKDNAFKTHWPAEDMFHSIICPVCREMDGSNWLHSRAALPTPIRHRPLLSRAAELF